MEIKTVLLDSMGINRAIKRISHEIIENNKGVKNIVMLGIAKGGVPICDILEKNIFEIPHVILIAKIKILPNTMNIKKVNKKVII